MNIINHLKNIYGYGTPILLKNLRIGGKSKEAIRQELSRACKRNEITRNSNGIYYFIEEKEFPKEVSFEDVIIKKFIKDDFLFPGLNFNVYGYFTGLTFLNSIGITTQVPAIPEIVTNNTSCKRFYVSGSFKALLRKPKVEIDFRNYKALQFFDIFYYLSEREIEDNKSILLEYIEKNLTKMDFKKYIHLYSPKVVKIMVEKGLIDAFR